MYIQWLVLTWLFLIGRLTVSQSVQFSQTQHSHSQPHPKHQLELTVQWSRYDGKKNNARKWRFFSSPFENSLVWVCLLKFCKTLPDSSNWRGYWSWSTVKCFHVLFIFLNFWCRFRIAWWWDPLSSEDKRIRGRAWMLRATCLHEVLKVCWALRSLSGF